MQVILASASPRRREILARIAYPFEVRPADVDESQHAGEDPEAYVRRLAREKALVASVAAPQAVVIGADTAVVIDGRVLGKPGDASSAARMLAELSGRTHHVLSGVAIARGGEVRRDFLSRSEVRFRKLADAEIASYAASEEPLDKAGAYSIQGGAGRFVTAVDGSVTCVIGLPLEETAAALAALGAGAPEGALSDEAVALRWRSVAAEVAARAVACGRPAGSVRLVTVTKGHPARVAAAVAAAGARDLGENYVQEARDKRELVAAAADGVRWHLIGSLQRNKARLAGSLFDVVHTIDRFEVAAALAKEGAVPLQVLVQVNVDRDPAKAGVAPEATADLLGRLRSLAGLEVVGLMTVGRESASADGPRATFAALRELREVLREKGHEGLRELSMGMSGDYHAAIEEGATLVRLGTAIVGPRSRGTRGG